MNKIFTNGQSIVVTVANFASPFKKSDAEEVGMKITKKGKVSMVLMSEVKNFQECTSEEANEWLVENQIDADVNSKLDIPSETEEDFKSELASSENEVRSTLELFNITSEEFEKKELGYIEEIKRKTDQIETLKEDFKKELSEQSILFDDKFSNLSKLRHDEFIELSKKRHDEIGELTDRFTKEKEALQKELQVEKEKLQKDENLYLGEISKYKSRFESISANLKSRDKDLALVNEANEHLTIRRDESLRETNEMRKENKQLQEELSTVNEKNKQLQEELEKLTEDNPFLDVFLSGEAELSEDIIKEITQPAMASIALPVSDNKVYKFNMSGSRVEISTGHPISNVIEMSDDDDVKDSKSVFIGSLGLLIKTNLL